MSSERLNKSLWGWKTDTVSCAFAGRSGSPAGQELGAIVDVCGVQRREKGRRISAFNYFVKHMVPIVRKENPGMVHQSYMKQVAQVFVCTCSPDVFVCTSKLCELPCGRLGTTLLCPKFCSHFVSALAGSCSPSRSRSPSFI